MKSRKKLKNTILIFIISYILFCFFGCRLKAEQKSLSKQFDSIDALIMQNQTLSALKELKKTEKKVHDVWSYIGVFKRYQILGESVKSEKILQKALKKNSGNVELLAVYTNFLLRQGRLDESAKTAQKLKGTKYASLYSEFVLRKMLWKKDVTFDVLVNDEMYYQIFMDAYKGGKNSMWLRNCAVYCLLKGLYNQAVSVVPEYYADVDDSYFWALCYYDAGKYYDSIEALDASKSLLKDYSNKAIFKTTLVRQVSLESDAYMAVSDMQSAEAARQAIVLNIDNMNVRKNDEALLSTILLNSAVWAGNQGMDGQSADLLFYIVNRWQDFVPGLIFYSDFAYRSSLEREEDAEIKALRRAGIRSLEMEKYDNRRKIPLSDAIFRIDSSIERTNDPYLNIARLDLKYKTDKSISEKDKNRDLWMLLENSFSKGNGYDVLLVEYALSFLLKTKQYDDAWNLFYKYVVANGSYDEKKPFWQQFIAQVRLYDLPIAEFGAWFSAFKKLTDEALRLYEYCVYESGGILEDGFISQDVSTASCMNLGDIYVSLGKNNKALDVYGKIAGRESRNSLRSEIFYRIACIYAGQGDIKNALRSAEYSYSLYPENARASLLKEKLMINE